MTNPTRNPGPYRVDLTSQDLRTGIIRLPRQLHHHFEPGVLNASQTASDEALELQHIAPSELHGLRDFFDEHQLRTNDALLIHLAAGGIQLEPFYRNRRRSEVRASRHNPEGAAPSDPEDPHTPDAAVSEPDTQAAVESHPLAADDQQDEQTPEGQFAQNDDVQHQDTYAHAAAGSEAGQAGPEGDAFDDFSAFDDLGELDPLDFELDQGAANHPDDAEAPQADAPSPQIADPGAIQAHHAAPRRSFGLSAGRAPVHINTAKGGESSEPAPAPHAGAPTPAAGTNDPLERVRRHLNEPGLPSILQESTLASNLAIPQEELAEILAAISREPESRLGTIRPGYWLLKRESQD